jgi:hypothetical protein
VEPKAGFEPRILRYDCGDRKAYWPRRYTLFFAGPENKRAFERNQMGSNTWRRDLSALAFRCTKIVEQRIILRRFYFRVGRKKGGQIAKVATARELLEWIYHILRDGRTYQEMEKIGDLLGRGEPGKNSGSA